MLELNMWKTYLQCKFYTFFLKFKNFRNFKNFKNFKIKMLTALEASIFPLSKHLFWCGKASSYYILFKASFHLKWFWPPFKWPCIVDLDPKCRLIVCSLNDDWTCESIAHRMGKLRMLSLYLKYSSSIPF